MTITGAACPLPCSGCADIPGRMRDGPGAFSRDACRFSTLVGLTVPTHGIKDGVASLVLRTSPASSRLAYPWESQNSA